MKSLLTFSRIAFGVSLLVLYLLCYPFKKQSVVFRAVDEQQSPSGISFRYGEEPPDDFLVRDGAVYLKSQTLSTAVVIVTGIQRHPWGREKVEELLQQHPELRGRVPLQADADGEMPWYLKNSGSK